MTTTLFFGKREYDARTRDIAAEWLRAQGHSVTERFEGDYQLETGAPHTTAIAAKQHARAVHEREVSAS